MPIETIDKFFQKLGYWRTIYIEASCAGFAEATPLRQYSGEPIYHITGACAMLLNRLSDHLSTIPIIRLLNSPTVRQHPELLQNYAREGRLLGPHTTITQQLKTLPFELAAIALGAYFPPIGYGFAATTPMTLVRNIRSGRELREKIGELEARAEETAREQRREFRERMQRARLVEMRKEEEMSLRRKIAYNESKAYERAFLEKVLGNLGEPAQEQPAIAPELSTEPQLAGVS